MDTVKVLIVNSDLAVNRGDRAIAAGLLALLRETVPDAQPTLISEFAERDAGWYDAKVINQGIHSLSPLDLLRLMRAARKADVVLWGGGELLKDYTNKLGVWYWSVKMAAVSSVNSRVIGAFQGIGPTTGRTSRWLIARTVNRTRLFITRDEESKQRLEKWGAKPGTVVASFDSAVYAVDTDPDFPRPFEKYAVVAPRQWFHYRKGGILPYRWRRSAPPSERSLTLKSRMVEIIDHLVETHGGVVLMPMHMSEDPVLVAELVSRAARPDRVVVLDEDAHSPEEIRSLLAGADLMVAFRLHAGIIATSVGVPTITYYYVDKGRLYADQVGAAKYTRPIERLLEDGSFEEFKELAESLVDDAEQHRTVATALSGMRDSIRAAFRQALAR